MDDHFWMAWVLKPDWGGKGIKKEPDIPVHIQKSGSQWVWVYSGEVAPTTTNKSEPQGSY